MHSDDAFAPVAYLVVKKFHLEEKDKDVRTNLMKCRYILK